MKKQANEIKKVSDTFNLNEKRKYGQENRVNYPSRANPAVHISYPQAKGDAG